MKIREIKRAIEKYGIPGRDLYELPTSPLTFPDGNFRSRVNNSQKGGEKMKNGKMWCKRAKI